MNTTSNINDLLTVHQIAELVPSRRKNRKTSAQTVNRWMTQGLKGVKLKYTLAGTIRCATVNDVDAFFKQLTGSETR